MDHVLFLFEEPFENWATFATPNNMRHVRAEPTEPPSLPEDIETVIWHSISHAWEDEWELLGRLRNGLWFFYQASCVWVSTTPLSNALRTPNVLSGSMTMTLGDTLEEVVQHGMPEHSRRSYQVETTHSIV